MNNLLRLVNHYGFRKFCSASIDRKTKRLSFGNVYKGQYTNIIYCIAIDDEVVYIGQTKDFWKRTDTYKNSKYWAKAWVSNKKKTQCMEDAVKSKKRVDFYYRQCFNDTMNLEEPRFVDEFKPDWNIHYNRKK